MWTNGKIGYLLPLMTALLLGAGKSARPVTGIPGVSAHWNFQNASEDSLFDCSGHGNSGRLYQVPVTDSGLVFNGKDGRIIVQDAPSLRPTGSLTIEACVLVHGFSKPDGGSHHGFILFRGDNRGANDPYFFSTEPRGTIRFHVESQAGAHDIEAPIPTHRWLHLAGTLEDSTGRMRLYVDGVMKKDTVTAIRPMSGLSPKDFPGVGIGNHAGYPLTEKYRFPFHGVLRELRLLDTAMSEAQVRQRYLEFTGQ